ncbi:transcriptional regulator, IclR family [Quadrisphaera granulorum]|uniref:IclR family transcriptional regulator n=1 Tax=Quadrisphaera granulorum TaxID=317664 RepID=A0A316AYP4_9ACTN|nr:IclR family transcriptional regulator [Quadrisphaera granulorum]SZE95411.1 transcriptional regulator, IclR family [Quadrisphaera granulorum]
MEEIAVRTGIPPSSAYRYVARLAASGYLEEQRGRYTTGPAVLALAGRYVVQPFLAQIGPAYLRDLVRQLGETVVMLVRVGSQAVCLRKAEPEKALIYSFAVDELLPLHAGAGQRVLLAWAPPPVVEQVLSGPLPRYTPATLDAASLRADLATTRQRGWATSRGELDPGSFSLAVPVTFRGEVVCSLNAAGPDVRCDTPAWITRATSALLSTASALSAALQEWSPSAPTRGPHDS